MPNQDKILARLDGLMDAVAELRALVIRDEAGAAAATNVTEAQPALDSTKRSLTFLKHFYDAPGRSLHKTAASQAAIAAGYDPRGTAGYYVGAG